MQTLAQEWDEYTGRLESGRTGDLKGMIANIHGNAKSAFLGIAISDEHIVDAFNANLHAAGDQKPGRLGPQIGFVSTIVTSNRVVLAGILGDRDFHAVLLECPYSGLTSLSGEHVSGGFRKKSFAIRYTDDEGEINVLSGDSVDQGEQLYTTLTKALNDYQARL